MDRKWIILAVLTLARTAMGYQFQSISAVSVSLNLDIGLSHALIGTLIGLYLFPGIVVSIPGGWLGQKFGDKRVVVTALALMAFGGGLAALTGDQVAMMAGRLISGAGAVVLNVLLTKMLADWFPDRHTVTAMAVLIVSWPVGIALAMVSLPVLSETFGVGAAMVATSIAATICLLLMATSYSTPRIATPETVSPHGYGLSKRETLLTLLAGTIWALYNVGCIVVLALSPG